MADNDDIKKVLIPKDKDGNGELGNNFPNYDVPRPYVPVRDSGEDDLPFEGQPIQNGTVPVSIRSARQRAGQDSLINRNQIGASETLESDRQYLPNNRAASTINRPSHTRTLGDFLKKGDLGVRTNASRPRQADAIPGDTLLRSVNPPSPGPDPLNPFGSRVKGTPGPEYGNQLVEEGAGPVVERTVSAVLNQNRFSSIATPNVYAPSQQNPDQATFTSTQGLLGSYTPAGDNQRELSLEDMKSVAMDLISAAMGMKEGTGIPGVQEQRVIASDVRVNRLGTGAVSATAADALQIKGSDGEFFEPGIGEVKSYGQLNSPDEFFDGLAPLEMISLAFATLAVSAAYLTGGSLLLGIANAITGEDSSPGTKPYSLGSFQKTNLLSRTVSSLISREDFGLIYTRASLSDSLQAGIASLLGIGGSTNLGSVEGAAEVARALANITRSPGFYVVFSRAILRDIVELRDKIGNLSSIAPGQPGAFTFLDVLKTSKVVGGINALAAVGDALLTGDTSPFNLDKLTDAPMKSRSGTGKGETASDLRLAWRNSNSPSMLLLSPGVVFGQAALPRNGRAIAGMSSLENTDLRSPSSGRIEKMHVKHIEAMLDAEYVPFYFHDLRTNEIVSFHAFLNNLTDDFNASYNPSRAIGRADPIRVYSNTTRNISFSFYVAATSSEDFDQMWYKINKLVTLLYPQYTKGRKVTGKKQGDKQDSFIMPFSQVMAASPMIRLRIGDVVRSNYSKFNLSRLFGLGTKDFVPDASKLPLTEAQISKFFESLPFTMTESGTKMKKAVSDARKYGKEGQGLQVGDIVKISYPSVLYLDKDKGFGDEVLGIAGGFADLSRTPDRFYLPFRSVYAKVKTAPPSGFVSQARNAIAGGGPAPTYGVEIYATFADAKSETLRLERTRGATYKLGHHEATIMASGLKSVRDEIASLKEKLEQGGGSSGTLAEYFASVQNFFSAEAGSGNAVVRSFEESGGKGLPGFISRMGFNWINDRIPWETDLDSRAPKICEIRVSFEPVHDIGPGLDHQGFNRAPVYPVGQIVNQISDTKFDQESDDSIALGLNEAGHAEDKYSSKTEKYEKAIKDSS